MKSTLTPNTLVVIDAGVENYQQLMDGVLPSAKTFLLDGTRDGIEQIGQVLRLHPETDTLHIISHGSPGCLYLGNSQLSLDTLDHRYALQLQRWKLGNLLLYGCNVAAGDAGEEFVAKLHRLTGAGIAASQSPTGAAALGGDWELGRKIAMGQETLALSAEAMTAYQGILALLNADDYAALKALYDNTDGDNWNRNTGWDVSSSTPPEASVVDGWHGVTVVGDRVTGLYLYSNGLTGNIPSELGDLSNLKVLNLDSNELTGDIPSELGNLSNLQELYLDSNELTGDIPSELGDLSNLQRLYLSSNELTGDIPSELGNLSNLQELFLDSNELTGDIPSELGDLSNLKVLNLYSNQLTGDIPSELGNLSNLQDLSLDSNKLSGTIPDSVKNLSATKYLENPPYVKTEIPDQTATTGESFNLDISGHFGDINENISSYSAADLPNGLTISADSGIISGNLSPTAPEETYVVTVTVSDEENGTVNDAFDIMVSAEDAILPLNADDYAALKALYDNTDGDNWNSNTGWDVSSSTPPEASVVDGWYGVTVVGDRVTGLYLDSNELTGNIPSELGNLSNLEVLNLSFNQLTGDIPSELGNLSNLQVLSLDSNKLTGNIPSELGDLSNLQDLSLYSNELTGNIPSELGDLSNLQVLSLYSNELSGTIPDSVKNLSAMKFLENPPYVKTEIPDQTATPGESFNLDISGHFGDINENISSYSAADLPNGLTISADSGIISGNLSPTAPEETYVVTVTVSDENDGTIEDVFNITVSAEEAIPPITGTLQNDIIRGTADPESIQALEGNDRVYGYGGNDIVEGNDGKDIIYGGDGDDLLKGGLGDDRLYGDGGNDTLLGEDGKDILYGRGGNDLLKGGLGDDRLYGDGGNDTLLGEDGKDILYGRGGDDLLEGGLGDDRLYGGAGNDTLDGGLGDDLLYGNAGSDIFVLARGMGRDTIKDFENGTDSIQLGGGLSFGDLEFVPSGSNTLIKISSTGESLATLYRVDVGLVDPGDFV